MPAKKISHTVTRPGKRSSDISIQIPVSEDLVTTPGAVQIPHDVDFYSRKYPLESQNVTHTADRAWVWTGSQSSGRG